MNVCISVGHCHPRVTQAIKEQAEVLQHCTTMFYHPVPAHFAEELESCRGVAPDRALERQARQLGRPR